MRSLYAFAFWISSAIAVAAVVAAVSPIAPPTSTNVATIIKAPLERANGLPAVLASINGSKTYPFVIDFAANLFAISPEGAQSLDLPNVGTDEMGNVMVHVADLSIGGARFQGLTAAADPFLNGHAETGVIGVNVYRNVTFTIDFRQNLVIINPQGLPPVNGRDILAYQPGPGGAPSLWITICGARVLAAIDTAAPATLRLPRTMMDTLGCKHHDTKAQDTVGAQTGPSTVMDAQVDGDLIVGSLVIKRPIVRFGDGPQSFLGAGALKALTISLDQRQSRIRLAK